MTDDTRLSLFSAGSSSRTHSIRSSTTSATTLSNSEFSFGYNHSNASSGLTTPVDPSFTRSTSPAGSSHFKPLSPSAIVSSESYFGFLPPSAIAPRDITPHRPLSPPAIDIDIVPRDITPRRPLPPPSPIIVAREIAPKPLPPPPLVLPAKDSDLLNLILALQSLNRSMTILNSSLGSLNEDMTVIEAMLITRELLEQDLAQGQPDAGGEGHDDHEHEHDPARFAGSKKYLRHLYQKYAPRPTSVSHTPGLPHPETPKFAHLRELRLLQSP
ncbi:hypothetical protein FIBSPDRAFT_1049750 [Athelia psychrophila]|uniref:Uncharacterized protein n=1 Tax=Athelia psychrophila TaxID=1759441 RepID=A0A166BSN2_9AGAM|nr:hypothetical protein FIBSPDRAFT_1049750 [Fibularhizoctonia sp. CBS 109695]